MQHLRNGSLSIWGRVGSVYPPHLVMPITVEPSKPRTKYFFIFLKFGWKASTFVYHTIGLAATSYIRSLGVPCSQYIDDRHVGQLAVSNASLALPPTWSDAELTEAAVFICTAVLVSLGY